MADSQAADGHIQDLVLEDEMRDSYLTYAMSVIVSRALPDVRDGLKPSQRRVLVAMNDLNLGPRTKQKKCAKICGDTSGNYHPHGESVIYPTLVRMAQEFNMRYPLIDGQGNFGSIDGDPPAAMRYTEARVTEAAMWLLEDLERDTVDMVPNYDESRLEPTVLPGRFPNLLANGSSGIAVGMATNIPPHNIAEICDAIVATIANPNITVDELMRHVPGPDFPTGGILQGAAGLREAYESGRGIVQLDARMHTETAKNGKVMIVVTELPYQLNKVTLIERIAELVKDDKIEGISDVRDESDKEGIRLIIEVKKDEDEKVVINQLLKFTPLRQSFGFNMIALVNNRPEQLGLRELIKHYVQHRFDVIRRRTKYLLKRAEERAHIVEGLIKAIQHIDAIIALIKAAPSVDAARQGLMTEFRFSEKQADAILDMRLQRLTALETSKLEDEWKELQDKIAEYRAILEQNDLVYDIIREDTFEIKEKFGDARRTVVNMEELREMAMEDIIQDESVVVTISHQGYIKRMSLNLYRKQNRGGKGITAATTKDEDFIEHLFVASTHDYLCFFTNKGKIHWLKVYDIPELARTARGRAIINVLELGEGETVSNTIPVRTFDQRNLLMATRLGVVKKTPLEAYGRPQRGGIIAINLDEGDELIGVTITTGNDEVMLATRDGFSIRFHEEEAKQQGRATRGVKGITLREGDAVVDMIIVDKNGSLLTACENGYGKRTSFEEYPIQSRGGKGVINIRTSDRNGNVVGMKAVRDDDDLMLITSGGFIVRTPVRDLRVIGRATQGVRLITMKDENDKLIAMARVAKEDEAAAAAEVPDAGAPAAEAPGNDGAA